MQTIYLDNNSTTRVADEAIAAMQPFWKEQYGNPSSLHLLGQSARHAVEIAREEVAALVGARPREVIFTSGGTEANNLAILGMLATRPTKRHLVTSAVEHVSVHSLAQRLAGQGYRVTFLQVDSKGSLDVDALQRSLDGETALLSVMHANNETGVIFPIREIADIAVSCGVPLHVDAVQTAGKMQVDMQSLGASLLSISSHKMHGPNGAGALVVGPGMRLRSQTIGGHQERGLRPGTENVPAIVGFGTAARVAANRFEADSIRLATLRDRLERGLLKSINFATVIGNSDARICNTTNVAFEALEAEAILIGLSEHGLCASSGAACSSGSLEPSHVLQAMGVPDRIAHGGIRFSLSRDTTESEIDRALEIIPQVVTRLASLCANG